jgi:acetoin utilization deacetylase AcuC-like enzyme/GNAT superfamily N-acetyltransferase
MFRVRKVYDDASPANRDAIAQVQQIIADQFPTARPCDLSKVPQQLNDPLHYRYRSILLIVENAGGKVRGFAMLLHLTDLNIAFLELISTAADSSSGGIGGMLYELVREEALSLGAAGLYLECNIDDARVTDAARLRQNRQRMRFYERFGVRPIINNAYDSPVHPGDDNLYYLMFDGLGRHQAPRRKFLRRVVAALLLRKYGDLYDASAAKRIALSFTDDPAQIREPKYRGPAAPLPVSKRNDGKGIALLVNESHNIHHVRDRGYVEAPVRIPVILKELDKTGLFTRIEPRHTPIRLLHRVHTPEYVEYLREACAFLPKGKSIYPIIFPVRNQTRPPKDLELRLGYYCTDTFTPLHHNVYPAAYGAVDCAVSGARSLFEGFDLAYALVRPPGHHAGKQIFGGFCYFNASAVAAEYLSDFGRVAILDVDYHHGNGTQDIFYERGDVLTISIHAAPPGAYPHFAGFEDERGEGAGENCNINLPLPEKLSVERYHRTLNHALREIRKFAPEYLVIALGLDTAKADPTGSWQLLPEDFTNIGRRIGELHQRTLVVQEGGYRTRTLGQNARAFFEGLWQGHRPDQAATQSDLQPHRQHNGTAP